MTLTRPVVAGIVVVLALSGCASSGDGATSSGTSTSGGTASSSSGSSSSPSATATEAAVDGPQDEQLTVKEARAALPKLSALPKKYEEHSESTAGRDDEGNVLGTDPEKCAALYFEDQKAIDYRDEHMVAVAHRRYAVPSDGAEPLADISVDVVSHDEPYPLRFFDSAGRALAECDKFTLDDLNIATTATAGPALGDRTFAFRMEYAAVGKARDFLYVRSGHNLIRVTAKSSVEEYDASLMTELATTTLDNLKGEAG